MVAPKREFSQGGVALQGVVQKDLHLRGWFHWRGGSTVGWFMDIHGRGLLKGWFPWVTGGGLSRRGCSLGSLKGLFKDLGVVHNLPDVDCSR